MRLAVVGLHGGVTRDVHGHGERCNRQRARRINHVVVALHGSAGRCDGVGADILARCAAQRVVDDAQGVFILEAAHRSGKHRVGMAIDFRLVIRRHRHRRLGDGQFARVVVGHIVVRKFIARCADGILAHILAFLAGDLQVQQRAQVVFAIVVHHTGHRCRQRRIRIAILLRLIHGGHRQRRLVHNHSARCRHRIAARISVGLERRRIGSDRRGRAGEGVVRRIIRHPRGNVQGRHLGGIRAGKGDRGH